MRRIVCIVCPNGCLLEIDKAGDTLKINGYKCERGREFAVKELTAPTRTLTSTVKTIYKEVSRLSVRTDGEIPKEKIFDAMKTINSIEIDSLVHTGDILIHDIAGTGINLIATSDLEYLLTGRFIK